MAKNKRTAYLENLQDFLVRASDAIAVAEDTIAPLVVKVEDFLDDLLVKVENELDKDEPVESSAQPVEKDNPTEPTRDEKIATIVKVFNKVYGFSGNWSAEPHTLDDSTVNHTYDLVQKTFSKYL